jgi:integrase
MASLRRLTKSPYWIACFTLPDGRRTQRSTGTTDKRCARKIADKFDETAREGRAGKLTESRARKTIADIYALANTDSLPSSKINVFFVDWLKRKEIEAGPKTHQRYSAVVERFLRFLGPRANKDIAHLTSKEIAAFRDDLSKQLTIGTVNISVKIIRAALAQARRDRLVDVNEGEHVTLLKRTSRFERRPFTLRELKRIIEVADDEWRGMILCGLYTGQRLGDIAGLCWNNVDLSRRELRFVTGKTGRRQIIPIARPFADYLEYLPTSDDPAAPLFPRAYSTRQRNIPTGTLSNQFYRILVAAGLAETRTHESTGKGRSARRQQNELSFHCLRHTTTSLMKNAGISPAIVQEFIGHNSEAVSRHYTHIERKAMQGAADALPIVWERAF